MDLGTANTVILVDNKVVVDEPSIVAFDQTTGKPIAFGQKARLMHEKTHPNIKTVRPLRDIPKGSTEVEIRAVRDSAEHAGGRDIYMIFEPMAAAMGIGLDVEAPTGNMVVDIGGGTTEIAVISLGGIVTSQSIRVAGDVFTSDIQQYMRQQHNIKVGELTSEEIKIRIGAAIPELENTPDPFIVRGPNLMTAHPVEIAVTSQEIAHCLDKSLAKIEAAVLQVLEQTPPELYQDIVERGIFLTGPRGRGPAQGSCKRNRPGLEKLFAISFPHAVNGQSESIHNLHHKLHRIHCPGGRCPYNGLQKQCCPAVGVHESRLCRIQHPLRGYGQRHGIFLPGKSQ